MNKNILAASIDFGSDYSQICFYDSFMQEPQSVSTIYNDKRYIIPTVMWADLSVEMFSYGDEAVKKAERGKGMMIDNLYHLFESDKKITINDKEYTGSQMVEKYFNYLIKVLKENEKTAQPEYCTVAVEKLTKNSIVKLYKVLENIGFEKEKIRIISHSESFLYYVMTQEKGIWSNDVVMMDFNRDYFKYRRISIARNRHPMIIQTEEIDLTDKITYEMLQSEEGRDEADKIMAQFTQEEFRRHVVSAVYLTGTGFYEDWLKQSINVICNRRRVFKGYNLFVKGACYAAMECAGRIGYKDMVFQCENRTSTEVRLIVDHDEKKIEVPLSDIGKNWYEAGAYTECILDGDEVIRFHILSPMYGFDGNVMVHLDGFPKRPPRLTRVGISFSYENEDDASIIITDKGFGDFYKASGITVKEVMDMKKFR